METTWNEQDRPGVSLKVVLIFVVVSLIVAGVVYIATNIHALERHGATTISAATNCFDSNGAMLRMTNPSTKRNADICFDGVKFLVHITTAEGNPVTTFAKEKMRSIDQVVRYLCNAGYIMSGKPCPIQ